MSVRLYVTVRRRASKFHGDGGNGNALRFTYRGIGWLGWERRGDGGGLVHLFFDAREFLRVERAVFHHRLIVFELLLARRRHVLCDRITPLLDLVNRPRAHCHDADQRSDCQPKIPLHVSGLSKKKHAGLGAVDRPHRIVQPRGKALPQGDCLFTCPALGVRWDSFSRAHYYSAGSCACERFMTKFEKSNTSCSPYRAHNGFLAIGALPTSAGLQILPGFARWREDRGLRFQSWRTPLASRHIHDWNRSPRISRKIRSDFANALLVWSRVRRPHGTQG